MVMRYLGSTSANVLTFDDFSNLLLTEPEFTAAVLAVRSTWAL
jgi:hypothetical protein